MILPSLLTLCADVLTDRIRQSSIVDKKALLEKLSSLPYTARREVVSRLDLELEVELAGAEIEEEHYWRRRFKANWNNSCIESNTLILFNIARSRRLCRAWMLMEASILRETSPGAAGVVRPCERQCVGPKEDPFFVAAVHSNA